MAKKAVSVTLDSDNVLWLKGRARIARSTLSDTLDKVVTQVRTGRAQPFRYPSIVGMVDLSDDPDLKKADAAVRDMFDDSLARFVLHEDAPSTPRKRKRRPRD